MSMRTWPPLPSALKPGRPSRVFLIPIPLGKAKRRKIPPGPRGGYLWDRAGPEKGYHIPQLRTANSSKTAKTKTAREHRGIDQGSRPPCKRAISEPFSSSARFDHGIPRRPSPRPAIPARAWPRGFRKEPAECPRLVIHGACPNWPHEPQRRAALPSSHQAGFAHRRSPFRSGDNDWPGPTQVVEGPDKSRFPWNLDGHPSGSRTNGRRPRTGSEPCRPAHASVALAISAPLRKAATTVYLHTMLHSTSSMLRYGTMEAHPLAWSR